MTRYGYSQKRLNFAGTGIAAHGRCMNGGLWLYRVEWNPSVHQHPNEIGPELVLLPGIETDGVEVSADTLSFLSTQGVVEASNCAAWQANNSIARPHHRVIHLLRALRSKLGISHTEFDISNDR
jgi:hypothetical protein